MSVSNMKKLTAFVFRDDADRLVRSLMRLRCVQVRSLDAERSAEKLARVDCDRELQEARRRLGEVDAVLPTLSRYSTRKMRFRRRVHAVDQQEFVDTGNAERVWEIVGRAHDLQASIAANDAERAKLSALSESLQPWLDYDAPLSDSETGKTKTWFGSFPNAVMPETVTEALSDAGCATEEVYSDEKFSYWAITFLKEREAEAGTALASLGFVRQEFAPGTETALAASRKTDERLAELEAEAVRADEALHDCADALDEIEILHDVAATDVRVAELKQKLAETNACTVLEGWYPDNMEDAIAAVLSRFDCAYDTDEPEAGETPPVLLRNNRFAQNFEWVIGMYSYPKYGAYDPTFIMSIFYFLIFGMMFADVGYGLLLTLGCIAGIRLMNPKPAMRRMLSMFAWCGVFCMVLGVVFGGWFGDLPIAIMKNFMGIENPESTKIGHFFANGLLFNPVSSAVPFLILSLAVGEIHLVAGMAINMVETWKSGHRLEAVCGTVPFWVLFAGLDLAAPNMLIGMEMIGEGMSAATKAAFADIAGTATYLMLAGVVGILLLKGVGQKSFGAWLVKGLGGLYSLISFASDLLSYSRILALGLVAGVIGQVINMITALGASGVGGFIAMLVVLIVGHVFNIAINLLGTFVHAARLQYIEFFGKFYEDGGEMFEPAEPSADYTEDPAELAGH
mgnify:CR=1 FL=1